MRALLLACLLAPAAARAEAVAAPAKAAGTPVAPPIFQPLEAPKRPARAPLGATLWGAGPRGLADARELIRAMKGEGFPLVSFVPTYYYVDLDRIDFAQGPSFSKLEDAIGAALDEGLLVVLKPHLDPPPADESAESHTWRKAVGWRGYFDVDPTSPDYRDGLIGRSLELLARQLAKHPKAAPIRLELGAELMNSVTYGAPKWLRLLRWAKARRHELGMDKRILLSHNFEHHFEIPGDVVRRMRPGDRRALARYIKGLDALALSQYMDLTAAVPEDARGKRLPTADEVADALVQHEIRFREQVLGVELGLRPSQIPELHIGEFGVGTGGLSHPNEWAGALTPERELALDGEIARGHEGLARYLARTEGRSARSAVLWTVGPHYDVFGWGDRSLLIPAAAEADRAYLSGR